MCRFAENHFRMLDQERISILQVSEDADGTLFHVTDKMGDVDHVVVYLKRSEMNRWRDAQDLSRVNARFRSAIDTVLSGIARSRIHP